MSNDYVEVIDESRSTVLLEKSSLSVERAPYAGVNTYVAFADRYTRDDFPGHVATPWETREKDRVGDPPEEFGWFFVEIDVDINDYLRKRNIPRVQ